MPPAGVPEYILQTERAVLQAMCAGTPDGTVWDDGMVILRSYPFRDVIHQVIFDTLREINTHRPDVIEKQLPVRLVRKGFPAVDLSVFLARHCFPARAIVELMRALSATAPA